MPRLVRSILRRRASAPVLALLGVLAGAGEGRAQLRPLEPPEPWPWDSGATVSAEVGVGVFTDQRASLAGTEGTLTEAGNFAVRWRTGRVVLEAAGTAQRFFRDRSTFAEPTGGAQPDDDGRRHDSGDYRISTAVRLTPERAPALAWVRFGTRLPTTDNRVGLDRDQTDFFALAGGGVRRGPAWVLGEAGVGINGARSATSEQSDVLAYGLSTGYRGRLVTPLVVLVGQTDGAGGRGNEELAELRAGARFGGQRWVQVSGVRGLVPFSPGLGILISAGWRR